MRRPSGSCSSVAMPCRGQEETGFFHLGAQGVGWDQPTFRLSFLGRNL